MWGISNFLKKRKNDKCTQISSKGKGMEMACLELAEQLTPVMKKSGELGRGIVP